MTFYQSEAELVAWAEDKTKKRKLLFIDEANIGKRQWSEFKGLFNERPSIVINGQPYLLTPQHKVIFAGNPLNYGGERQVAPLFEQHGNMVVFDPLPLVCIYHKLLKPVFAGTIYEEILQEIAEPMLSVYYYINEYNNETVLISTRDVQMMALLTLSYGVRRNASPQEVKAAAQHYAYQLGKPLVPQLLQEEFEEFFKPEENLGWDNAVKDEAYLITPSRQLIAQQLDELLCLKQWQKEGVDHQKIENERKCYGGLGGMILEGEVGIGKSELVMLVLEARGYHKKEYYEGNEAEKESSETLLSPVEKIVYHLPASMPVEEKKKCLVKAFDEGAVVVIDEINSSPALEQLLNALLMGKTPEGKRPSQPGFLLIGTQNPVSMEGRSPFSQALNKRLIHCVVPPYTAEEMKNILASMRVVEKEIDAMVKAFEKNYLKAKIENLQPVPSFRDLKTLAEQYVMTPEEKVRENVSYMLGKLKTVEEELHRRQQGTPSYTKSLEKVKNIYRMLEKRSTTFFAHPSESQGSITAIIDVLDKMKL